MNSIDRSLDEMSKKPMSELENVASVSEVEPGTSLSVIVDDTPVLLCRVGDDFYAIEDVCTHDGQPLTDGPISGSEVTCSRHGARFDLKTGDALCMPATEGVTTFKVEVRDGEVFVGPQDDDERVGETPTTTAPASLPIAGPELAMPPLPENPPVSSNPGEGPDDILLIDALKQVIDPELMVNIVDLGLVYNVEAKEEEKVAVEMTLTSPACPAGPQIVQQAKMALERLEGVTTAEITLTMTPPWTPERMTDDARDQLGIF